ncbi:MAG: hypothetical protein Q8P67_17300, partial [archaeon]|nr:hypothetical protein [archaeon]
MISSVQLICLVGVVCMAWAVAGGPAGLAGLNPERAAAYSGTHYTCDGGAVKLPASRLNDDYCDCGDGSDEPGTAACAGAAGGRFYCPNVGHRATEIPSALVNDGVCDCCDGSDEWEKGGCQQDGCMEQFRRQREAWRELIQLHTAGAQIREAWEQQAEQELRALREAGVQLKEELGRAEEELAKAEERQREEREQRALERERDEPPLSLHNRIDDDTDEGDTQEIDPKLIAHLSPIDDDFDAFDAPSLVPETGDEDEEEIDGP